MHIEPAQRLIVAVDVDPARDPARVLKTGDVWQETMRLIGDLGSLDLCIKVHSLSRAVGCDQLGPMVETFGLRFFSDTKLFDSPDTLRREAHLLNEIRPAFVTVMCSCGLEGLTVFRETLSRETKVLGVTLLNHMQEKEVEQHHGRSIADTIVHFAKVAQAAGLDGLMLGARNIQAVLDAGVTGLQFAAPTVRPDWFTASDNSPDADQAVTPSEAIALGATWIIVGDPITDAKPNTKGLPQNPRQAAMRIIQEITPPA